MLIALAGRCIRATEKSPTYTAGDTVVIGGSIKGDLLFSWLWHGVTPLTNAEAEYHSGIFQQSGESTRVGVLAVLQ